MTKGREPRTEKEWNTYLEGINETELNMRNQFPENAATMTWAFSLLKLEAAFAYAKWVKKRVRKGLK